MKAHLLTYSFSCLVLLLFFQQESMAQDPASYSISNLTPPSPAAYSLGKYGQTSVGMYTGTNNASIPLYEYRTRNLSVPISLNYSSNGIKVDELGSNVGLSWSLNMGGAITRTVRDLPDETRTDFFPSSEIHKSGALTNPLLMTYFRNAGNDLSVDSEADQYLFNFNGYSGQFAFDDDHKIVLIPKQALKIEEAVTGTSPGFRITTPDGIEYSFFEKELTRKLVDGKAGIPSSNCITAWYLSSIKHPLGDVINFVYGETGSYMYVASQQQSLTLVPGFQSNCNGEVPVGYYTIDPVIGYNLSISCKRLTEINSNYAESGKIVISSNYVHPEVAAYKLVSAISVLDKSNAELERFDLSYLSTANKRVFLQKVTTKDITKNYQLSYIDAVSVPKRLSFDQDHWGYYNAKGNSYLFPNVNTLESPAPNELKVLSTGGNKSPDANYAQKGLLKRLTYPTGGYSDYTYEANTFRIKTTVLPPANVLSQYVNTNQSQNNLADTKTITNIQFDQEADLKLSILFDADNPSCPDLRGRTSGKLTISDLTVPSDKPVIIQKRLYATVSVNNPYSFDLNSDKSPLAVSLKAGHNYEFKLEATYFCSKVSLLTTYYSGASSQVYVNKITGGMRLQKIEVNDGILPASQITRYYYAAKESLDASSGASEFIPQYVSRRINRVNCAGLGDFADVNSLEVLSSSFNALYSNVGNATTHYRDVTLSHGGDNFENGGESHTFFLEEDMPGEIIYGANIPTAPWSNTGRFNGKEKSAVYFKKNGSSFIVLKEEKNTYVQDSRYYEEVSGYAVEKKCAPSPLNPTTTYTCTQDAIDYSRSYYQCTSLHSVTVNGITITGNHTWSMVNGKCISLFPPAPNNVLITVYGPCKNKNVGDQLVNTNALENLNIMEYKLISTWEYLSNSITTIYDANGLNPSTTSTSYEYGSPVHMQPTVVTNVLENAGTAAQHSSRTTIRYPLDFTFSGTPGGTAAALKSMADKHIWNYPIEQLKSSVTGSVSRFVDGQLTTYKLNGSVVTKDKDYALKFNNSSTTQDVITVIPATINTSGQFVYDAHYEQVNAYNRYDAANNLLQLTDRKNTFSLIREPNTGNVWAKVVNSNYGDIAYSSFEHGSSPAPAFTNWSYNSASVTSSSYQNGSKAYNLSGGLITSLLPLLSSQKYKVSFWRKVGSGSTLTVKAGTITLTPRLGPQRNSWQYMEAVFTGATSLQIIGNGIIDELRLYPVAAQMTSYVYKDGIGISSECNENNQHTFFEYNEFNRLKLVKDQDGNILKKNEYKYQNAQ